MARLSRARRLLQNAEAALISAIEIYNKPTFAYREETFSILALNAWELLVKAKLLSENNSDPRCLYVYEKHNTASGKLSKKEYVKRNRTGNIMTAGLENCLSRLEKQAVTIPTAVRKNLEALIEIRDNAVHYVNASPQLAKQVLELGTACMRNFIEIGKHWFKLDLSSYSLYLMPIGFLPSAQAATAISTSQDEKNVIAYLASLMKEKPDDATPDYHIALDVNISFKRSSAEAATAVLITNDPTATKVTLTEEDIRKQYPWDYAELTDRLKKRFIDFKENDKYHNIRKAFRSDPRFVKLRYLDPANQSGMKKEFYNPNFLSEFDKAYTLKK